MENIILTVHLIVALCLIGIVLVQRSEGGGLGVGGGGGGAMSGRPAISALGKLTWLFGIAFVVTSISLTVIAARNSNAGSVLDTATVTEPAQTDTQPAAPAGDALLPPTLPSSSDTPLAPPRVDE